MLHLEDYGGVEGRHKVQARLNGKMASYHHDKFPVVDFDAIKDAFPDAYLRAQRLNKSRNDDGDSFGCPTTTVGELVKKIIDNGRGVFSRAGQGRPKS